MRILEELRKIKENVVGTAEASVAIFGSRSVGKTTLARVLCGSEDSSFYYSYAKLKRADDSNVTLHVYDIDKGLSESDNALVKGYAGQRLLVLVVNLTNASIAYTEALAMLSVNTSDKVLLVGSHIDKAKESGDAGMLKGLLAALSNLCSKSNAHFIAVNIKSDAGVKKVVRYLLGLSSDKPELLTQLHTTQSVPAGGWSFERAGSKAEVVGDFTEKSIDDLVATRRAELATSRRIKTC